MLKEKDLTFQIFTKKEDIMLGFPIINQFYDKMDVATYESYIDEMTAGNNYFMLAAFLGPKLVGVAGFWILTRFYCGRYVQIGNMVVDKQYRNSGVGKILLNY